MHDGVYANLKAPDTVLEIELDRALELLAAKASGAGARKGAKAVLKELGDHPEGGAIQVLAGRYGPYVSWNKINATLPREIPPEAVTLEQALGWLAEKQSKPKSTRKGGATTRPKTAKRAAGAAEPAARPAAKSTTTKKKAAAKSTTTKKKAAAKPKSTATAKSPAKSATKAKSASAKS